MKNKIKIEQKIEVIQVEDSKNNTKPQRFLEETKNNYELRVLICCRIAKFYR